MSRLRLSYCVSNVSTFKDFFQELGSTRRTYVDVCMVKIRSSVVPQNRDETPQAFKMPLRREEIECCALLGAIKAGSAEMVE